MTTLDELERYEDGTPVNGGLHSAVLCEEIGKAFTEAAKCYHTSSMAWESHKKAHGDEAFYKEYRAESAKGDQILIAIHPKLKWFLEYILETNYCFDDEVPYSDIVEPEEV